jgi:hypothetical protein
MEGFLKEWLGIILSLIALGTVLAGWFTAGGKKAMTALDAYKVDVNSALSEAGSDRKLLEQRVQRIEDMIPHLPDKEDFHRIELAMTKIEGALSSVSNLVDKMDKYMRESGK